MKKLILLFVGVAVMMASCKKDDDNNDSSGTTPTPTKTNYVVRIDNRDSSYSKISYSGNNVSKVENFRANNSLDDYFTIEYNNDKISKVLTYDGDGNIGAEYIYKYINSDKPALITYVEDGDTATVLFEYENDHIKSWSYKIPSDNNPDSLIVYDRAVFTWAGDNIEKMEYYELENDILKLMETSYYQYDNKRNPFNGSLFYFAILDEDIAKKVCSKNNVTKIELINANGITDPYNSYNYTLEYNDSDDIIKNIEVDFNNDTIGIETYLYQTW